ncbi:hypothetical protein BHM03_00014018, partial [Ensete ventricosum]
SIELRADLKPSSHAGLLKCLSGGCCLHAFVELPTSLSRNTTHFWVRTLQFSMQMKKMISETHPATRRQPELYRCIVLPRRETNATILSLEFPHQNLSRVYESIRIKPRSRFGRISVWAMEEEGVFGLQGGQRGATKSAPSRRRLFHSSKCRLRRRNNPRGRGREEEEGRQEAPMQHGESAIIYIAAREGAEGRDDSWSSSPGARLVLGGFFPSFSMSEVF